MTDVWTPADTFPGNEKDKWSRVVVTMSNLGVVRLLSNSDGVWQRTSDFHPQERVAFWVDKPKGY